MGNSAVVSGTVTISYLGREFALPVENMREVANARQFMGLLKAELATRGLASEEVKVHAFWAETDEEVVDADFSDPEALAVRSLAVRVERSAQRDALEDSYALEEQLVENGCFMLAEETRRICDHGRGTIAECKSPDFSRRSFEELDATLRKAGRAREASRLADEVKRVMTENVRKLNEASTLAQQIFERFAVVARGLQSGDSKYISEAVAQQRRCLEGIEAVTEAAEQGLEGLKAMLGKKQASYQWRSDARACANSGAVGVCTVVPSVDGGITYHALQVGAGEASKSSFTSWLTTAHSHFYTFTKITPSGTTEKVVAVVTHHFHMAALAGSGGVGLVMLAGLMGFLRYRWKRLGAWRRSAGAFAATLESVQVNEEHWQGLRFSCDRLRLLLDQASAGSVPTSHMSLAAWKQIVRDTAVLISTIDAYLVWLDLAGWVPVSIGLRGRLQLQGASKGGAFTLDRYALLADMLTAPPLPAGGRPQREEGPGAGGRPQRPQLCGDGRGQAEQKMLCQGSVEELESPQERRQAEQKMLCQGSAEEPARPQEDQQAGKIVLMDAGVGKARQPVRTKRRAPEPACLTSYNEAAIATLGCCTRR